MKKVMIIATLLVGSVLSGCTNYLYQGSIKAEDSAGKQRQVVLYWSKTDPLIGDEKADIAHLLTECSNTVVVFENQPEGIIFRGEPQRDRVMNSAMDGNSSDNIECGRIQGVKRLTELDSGKVSLTIQCKPMSDEFSVRKRTYIKARETPYVFDITKSKKWSFLGSTPDAPKKPACNE